MSEVEKPDWVVAGAEVLVISHTGAGGTVSLKKTTIKKVATKSFTVEAPYEPRFSLPDCSAWTGGTWGSHRVVVPIGSDCAREELRAQEQRNQISRARTAVETWDRNRTLENRLAAIVALQAIENDEVK